MAAAVSPLMGLFGTVWGLNELVAGGAFYPAYPALGSVWLIAFAFLVLAAARAVVNRPGSSALIGVVAALYKAVNTEPFYCHLLGIVLVGLAFDAAAWFFRLCRYLAYRGTESSRPVRKTRATGWLVGLGFCLLSAPLIAMLYHFNIIVHPPTPPSSLESVDNWIHWSMGVSLLGVVMMIVGLVWRRPIVEQQAEPLPTSDNVQLPDALHQ